MREGEVEGSLGEVSTGDGGRERVWARTPSVCALGEIEGYPREVSMCKVYYMVWIDLV